MLTIHFNTGHHMWLFDKPFIYNLVLYIAAFPIFFFGNVFSLLLLVLCSLLLKLITVVGISKNNGRIRADWSFSSSSLLVDKDVSKPRSTVGISTNRTSKSLLSHHYEYNLFKTSSPLMISSWAISCSVSALFGEVDFDIYIWRKLCMKVILRVGCSMNYVFLRAKGFLHL